MSKIKCNEVIRGLDKSFNILKECLKEYEVGELKLDTAELMIDIEFGMMIRLVDEYLKNRKVENEKV